MAGEDKKARRHLYFKRQKSLCKAKNNFASKSCKLFFFSFHLVRSLRKKSAKARDFLMWLPGCGIP